MMPAIVILIRLANTVGLYPGHLGAYFLCPVVSPLGGVTLSCVALFAIGGPA